MKKTIEKKKITLARELLRPLLADVTGGEARTRRCMNTDACPTALPTCAC